jgi:hypothetical protein
VQIVRTKFADYLDFPTFCRNVTNIALDHTRAIFSVHVADELDIDAASGPRFKRQVVVSDISLLLQLSKSGFRCLNVSERSNVPKCFANEFFSGIIQ